MAGSSSAYTRSVANAVASPGAGGVIATLTITENPSNSGFLFYNNGYAVIEVNATQTGTVGPLNNLGVYVNGVLRTNLFVRNVADNSSFTGIIESLFKSITFPDNTVIQVKAIAAAVGTTYEVGIRAIPFGLADELEANRDTENSSVSVTNFPAVQAVSQSGAWTVGVNNFPADQLIHGPVSVTNFPAVQLAKPFTPASADILGGSAVNTNGATIITIPAGRTWYGMVSIASTNTTAVDWVSSVSIQGAGAVPAAGTIVVSSTGAMIGIPITAAVTGSALSAQLYVAATGGAVTLRLDNPTASSAIATAHGILL